jgi:hypothetical protein
MLWPGKLKLPLADIPKQNSCVLDHAFLGCQNMCFPFPVLQDAAGVAKAMALAAVKVKCGGTVRR